MCPASWKAVPGCRRCRARVREQIKHVAEKALDLSDFWEYTRWLQLLQLPGAREVIQKLLTRGLASPGTDIRDTAEHGKKRPGRTSLGRSSARPAFAGRRPPPRHRPYSGPGVGLCL